MKQTAMQKLKQKLHLIALMNDEFDPLIQSLINDIDKEFIPMEKEQLVNAHLAGLIYPLEVEAQEQAKEYYKDNYEN